MGMLRDGDGPKKVPYLISITAQKMLFSIKDFFSKCDQIRSFLRIWSDSLKKSLMENFIFCAVRYTYPSMIISCRAILN